MGFRDHRMLVDVRLLHVFLSGEAEGSGPRGLRPDWNAGVPACNIAASAMSAALLSNHNRFFVLRTHAGGDACVPVASADRYFLGSSDTVKKSPVPSYVRSILITSSNLNGRAPRRPKTAI